MAGAYLQPATVVQAVGRMVRPQFEEYIPDGQGVTGASKKEANAAKYLILLEKGTPAQGEFVEVVDEIDHPESDEEEDEGEWEQLPPDGDVIMQDGEEEWEPIPDHLEDVNPDEARVLLGED